VLGARPLRRTIQREIEDHLSEKILFSELKAGQIVIVDTDGETGPEAKFTFKGVAKPAAVPDAPPEDIAAKAATAAPISGPASGSAATGSSEAVG
jgi:ATP-dependent Clp protease ATP-binding subunit ClpC